MSATPQIRAITVHTVPVPLVRPFVTAVRSTNVFTAVLVAVHDTDGRTGWGEAPVSWRVTGESAASVRAAINEPISQALLGRPLTAPPTLSALLAASVTGNAAARMAVDCAIYDLAAQHADTPLHAYLHPTGRPASVRTDMTLSAATTDAGIPALAETATQHVQSGFDTLKVKVGAGADDIAVMSAVREAVGNSVHLRADANQGWTASDAIRIIRAWEDRNLNIGFVEQPVGARDLRGMAEVVAAVQTPVMADESVRTTDDLEDIISLHAADAINIKLAKTGGITNALALAYRASESGINIMVGCMLESHVGIAAAASLSAALGLTRAQDLDAGHWLTRAPVSGGISMHSADIILPNRPGLAITALGNPAMETTT
ncbi:mandelate racemase/muconate lactonizing enzyme family protein [Curtobacterium luteum]|uniref:mandelate racemase/muconate lactonizing enzyme family protein n=1 Tax=Curtobacterium luteum TaxID=33881 RepID=UPI00381DB004